MLPLTPCAELPLRVASWSSRGSASKNSRVRMQPMSAMAAASQRSTIDSIDNGATPMLLTMRSASASDTLPPPPLEEEEEEEEEEDDEPRPSAEGKNRA